MSESDVGADVTRESGRKPPNSGENRRILQLMCCFNNSFPVAWGGGEDIRFERRLHHGNEKDEGRFGCI